MIETKGPEETDSQTLSVWDSEGNNENGTSACVTHSPRNISKSQASLLAVRALEDFVEKRETEISGFDGKIRQYHHHILGEPCHTKIESIYDS